METLLTNEFCEIKRTIEDRLLRIDLILNTEMYIPYFIDENGNLLKPTSTGASRPPLKKTLWK